MNAALTPTTPVTHQHQPTSSDCCNNCTAKLVCRCLRVTEDVLLEALETLQLRSVKEIRQHTGAGDGCMACHRRLRQYLERQQSTSTLQPAELAGASAGALAEV